MQKKLSRGLLKNPHARSLPPTLLEWRSIRQRTNTALPLTLPDNNIATISVDSWTTCEEAATQAINSLGVAPEGWSVVMDDAGIISEGNGLDYIMDLVSELELCPAFPISKSTLLKLGVRKAQLAEMDHSPSTPTRPQVPPPEPPINLKRKTSKESLRQSPSPYKQANQITSRKASKESHHEYSPQRESPTTSTPARKSSHEALSRNSALNERYFDIEKVRSRSLDNLLSEPEPSPLVDLGLSQSRLNDRYHSVEQLAPIQPIIANQNVYMSKQEIDFEYPDISSVGTSNRGGPRYIKSQYSGKKAPPGSHSSRAYIEKSEFGVRSSAMSDTSETPSLASHVRRVRVPSQASDVDQFLDELFSPVLDGNLDELSDARSLAASIKGGNVEDSIEGLDEFLNEILTAGFNNLDLSSSTMLVNKIKGGGHRNRNDSQGSSALDQEVENLTSVPQSNVLGASNCNVDDYISDLFRPIFINDSLKALTEQHNLVDIIKGGGTTHQQNSPGPSYNFPTIPAPIVGSPPVLMPLLSPSQEGFMPVYNVPPGGIPPNSSDMATYQQSLQRAFLQSAMAQNIQIQQQLLAQNQALQQLLTQQIPGDSKQNESKTPNRKASFRGSNGAIRKSSSPSTHSSVEYKSRKASSDSNVSVNIRSGIPPPPPPMPPPLDCTDPSEVRPFLDPYGRAKTVRIGKWRWPPPQDERNADSSEDFMQFKYRQQNRKLTPNAEQSIMVGSSGSISNTSREIEQGSAEWEEIEFEPIVTERLTKSNSKRSFEVGASRPSPGSIGKLKLSSEMRQRLEKVTANHSVRSTSSKVDKPARVVNKLEDTRKMMLEQQLAGRWGDESQDFASGKSSPVVPHGHNGNSSPTPHSWSSSSWQPGPPPPPIGPGSLPPAPPGPAPPPPVVRPNQPPPPVEPPRDSFIAQRQDRDTFGVHQNRVTQNNSKRNSFSANWEVQSAITQDTHDENTHWAKETLDDEKNDGRLSRDSWDQADSTTITSFEQPRRWEVEKKSYEKVKHIVKEAGEIPTFRTHQFNKSAQEREKKHSIASTQMTDKSDKNEGKRINLEKHKIITKFY